MTNILGVLILRGFLSIQNIEILNTEMARWGVKRYLNIWHRIAFVKSYMYIELLYTHEEDIPCCYVNWCV